ncbi:hypothetical protein E5S13_002988 [Escherichia coli]|nr:hypothetical protein [Escherichia coli]HAX2066168.1 hypothetical protein [Escherichia coli]
MTIHYHGLPIWGDGVAKIAVKGAGAFVSFIRPDQIRLALKHADNVAIDNGAFSAWRRGVTIKWSDFYKWLEEYYYYDNVSFFVIPDVIDGDEFDNDALIKQVPYDFKLKSVPTWHLHEPIGRLLRLCDKFPKVCFGSSGIYHAPRSKLWAQRMNAALTEIYVKRDLKTKIHGLRMLDGRIIGNYPLDSADSTNLACNVPKYKKVHKEITKQIVCADYCSGLSEKELKTTILRNRCSILKHAIESVVPPTIEEWKNNHELLHG